jgi:hypothetical protein
MAEMPHFGSFTQASPLINNGGFVTVIIGFHRLWFGSASKGKNSSLQREIIIIRY